MVRDVKGKEIMKDEKHELTEIKEVNDLEQRIKNLEAIFSHLRDKNLKQKARRARCGLLTMVVRMSSAAYAAAVMAFGLQNNTTFSLDSIFYPPRGQT
ncbi:hypothetical protein Tco_1336647 [Tanacetum coccineum]